MVDHFRRELCVVLLKRVIARVPPREVKAVEVVLPEQRKCGIGDKSRGGECRIRHLAVTRWRLTTSELRKALP